MEVFFKKFIGWVLLIAGIWLVGWSLYSAFGIFKGTRDVPRVFKFESVASQVECPKIFDTKSSQAQQLQNMQEQVQKIVEGQMKEQIKNIIPPEFVEKILNLASWAVFLGLLIFAGSQISGVGVKLLRV